VKVAIVSETSIKTNKKKIAINTKFDFSTHNNMKNVSIYQNKKKKLKKTRMGSYDYNYLIITILRYLQIVQPIRKIPSAFLNISGSPL